MLSNLRPFVDVGPVQVDSTLPRLSLLSSLLFIPHSTLDSLIEITGSLHILYSKLEDSGIIIPRAMDPLDYYALLKLVDAPGLVVRQV